MREGFDELGTDADDRAGAPRTSPPRAARGATAVLLGATSPAAVSPAAAPAATSVADFVQRLQLLWLRNSPAAVPDARQPARRWRRAEGEDDDDDDDGDDEALPPPATPRTTPQTHGGPAARRANAIARPSRATRRVMRSHASSSGGPAAETRAFALTAHRLSQTATVRALFYGKGHGAWKGRDPPGPLFKMAPPQGR